jgi:FkbM family methyltransferase
MSLKNNLRASIPEGIWQTLGFCKRLPMYWRVDRSESLRVRRRLQGLPLFVTDEIHVFCPENLTAYICWKAHGLEDPISSVETRDFLQLAKGRNALVDIGAQTGFMSALFAQSRPGSFKILSLEPDPQVLPILRRAKELNEGQNGNWQILPFAVSNITENTTLPISNFVYESQKEWHGSPGRMEVQAMKLSELFLKTGWVPDIVKIDVESFEYEILTSSFEFLNEKKPALQLEVHWKILESRNRSAKDFLSPLADIGYQGIQKRYRNFDAWKRARQSESVSRFSLYAS